MRGLSAGVARVSSEGADLALSGRRALAPSGLGRSRHPRRPIPHWEIICLVSASLLISAGSIVSLAAVFVSLR
jgi:hypothetical protein